MGEVIINKSYGEFKQEMDQEIQKTAEGFVRIGYLLKLARDTNVLAESGYATVTEFAQKEYGLDKTQVSRFISINDRFSEGGCSDHLLPEYQGFGYAKLTIMLQIPEAIAEELSPNLSKADVQAIKEEVDEEKKVSDLEVLMEEKKDEEESILFRTIKQLGHDDPDLYERIWNERVPFTTWEEVGPILAPSGDKVYSVRIPGVGRVMMIMQDGKDEITITNTRTFEKEIVTRQDVANECVRILREEETAAESWEKVYHKDWPKGKVAPVQQHKKEEKAKPAKKESRVTKAKTPEKPKKPSTETTPAAVVEVPLLPRQMKAEDFPEEMMPPEEGEKNDQHGMPDGAGNKANDGESCGVDEKEAGEEPDALQDHGADGAEQGEGSEGDIARGNRETFNLIHSTTDQTIELFTVTTADRFWAYNLEKLRRAYRLAVDAAAGMEKLAQKMGWNLHEE